MLASYRYEEVRVIRKQGYVCIYIDLAFGIPPYGLYCGPFYDSKLSLMESWNCLLVQGFQVFLLIETAQDSVF